MRLLSFCPQTFVRVLCFIFPKMAHSPCAQKTKEEADEVKALGS